MDTKEAFKIGFMAKLAEAGMTTDDLYKIAEINWGPIVAGITGLTGGALGAATSGAGQIVAKAVETLGDWVVPVAYGVPALGGLSAGALIAKMTSPDPADMSVIRNKNMARTYKQLADAAKLDAIENEELKEEKVYA